MSKTMCLLLSSHPAWHARTSTGALLQQWTSWWVRTAVANGMLASVPRSGTNFAPALRATYSAFRPAQPVLFLDGTGGALGRGICHAELGCADFVAVGDADAKQSRATLQPLALYAGTDHAADQRSNLPYVFDSYNKLVKTGSLQRTVDDQEECLPCRPCTAADMQGAKATYGMSETSHSTWCKCQRADGGPQHSYPTAPMETYEDMIKYIEETVGCQIKTHEELCSWAHTLFTWCCQGGCIHKVQVQLLLRGHVTLRRVAVVAAVACWCGIT